MKIEKKFLKDLKPAEYNPRKANAKQEGHLKASLEKFGVVEPVIVNCNKDRENIIVGGHFRVRELKKLGYKEVDCVIVDLSLEDEKELNIRLNANTGDFDWDLLANNFDLEELNEWGLEVPDMEDNNLLDKNKEIDIDKLDTSECKIVFKFDAIMYESIISRIKKLKEENNFETNEVMFLELLQKYEL